MAKRNAIEESDWKMKRDIGCGIVTLIGLFIGLMGFLSRTSPFIFNGICALLMLLLILFVKEKIRRAVQGYWFSIEGDREGLTFFYHEKNKTLFFLATNQSAGRWKDLLVLPAPDHWQEKMPQWARDKRELVLGRITKKLQSWPYSMLFEVKYECEDETLKARFGGVKEHS